MQLYENIPAFEFFGVGRIIFGRGKFAAAGTLAATLGRKAMVIYNGEGTDDRLLPLLENSNVSTAVRRQRGEPLVSDVDAAVEQSRRENCECVIGIGGGSAVDAAKAIAAILTNGGSTIDYMEIVGAGKKITRPSLPWMAIPTTAGTGAEATRNAVIGLPEKRFKASIRSELMLPRIALVDPELGLSVPPAVTASSGLDALCQLIESYTSTGASAPTDALALPGIRIAARSLPRAFHDGSEITAREGMALAALYSGITLTSAGLGAVHGLAAPLGANFPVPHGTVCAALLPHIISANVHALREQSTLDAAKRLQRYAQIAQQFPDSDNIDDDTAIDGCIQSILDLTRNLKIPPLKQFGIHPANIPDIIALSRKSSSMRFNPIVLSDESLTTALTAAIG
jgi:alcohol dehydrogenase class IV